MTEKRNEIKCVLISMVVLALVGPVWAGPLMWPLPVGLHYECSRSNTVGDTWTVLGDVDGQTTANSQEYFHLRVSNYDSDSVVHTYYMRSTEDAVYEYYSAGPEHLVAQKAPVGTRWFFAEEGGEYSYRVIEIVGIESVTVPYGTFSEAYVHRNYKCNDPSNPALGISPDWYDWIVPGVGLVKEVDYWARPELNPPLTQELLSLTLPTPPVASFKSLNVVELGDPDEETREGGHMVGGVIRFDPSDSKDPSGGSLQYEWNFQTGDVISSDGPKRDVVFKMASVYTVALTVTNSAGLKDTCTETLDLTLKVGDLIFIRTAGYTTLFNLADQLYTHVGMYVGDDWMIESILTGNGRSGGATGVVKTLVRGWAFSDESYATLARVKTADDAIREQAVAYAERKLGQGYDIFVNKKSTGQPNFYCSELVWGAYYVASKAVRGPKGIIDLGNTEKKAGVWPDHIINDTANVERVGYHHEYFPP